MPTSNIPLTYAVNANNVIHLYVLIYAGSQPDFEAGEASGNKMLFLIEEGSTGTTKYFKHYSFNAGTFTDIEVRCDGHIRKIVLADLDNDSTPAVSGDQALEVPYAYTQIEGADSFRAEIVIFSSTPQKYDCEHTGPGSSVDGDTESNIVINTQVSATTEFSDSHTFNVTGVLLTNGAHETAVMTGDPPRRKKARTRNKNHSQTPFPRSRKNKTS